MLAIDENSTLNELRAAMAELKRERKPKRVGVVPVDAGSVEFAFAANLKGAHELYIRAADLTCWTCRIAFDGRRGAVKTPDGDGPVVVVRSPGEPPAGAKFIAAVSIPDAAAEMVMGDCGRIYVRVPAAGHYQWTLYWVDGRTGPQLWIV